ncbi:hypothetical protein AKJ64_00420 [candidate division MSBL1 archaeon SCGC-AAA259E17]|uniref:Uncharacterized protein n=1 Tax=candidate division MSBL1 archaeon SCGC-AAA259E17 TaxID=1698263 RepID=A0A133UGZ1_9EURY|nr:hypothetical protein AKJ64_00420 [candidate division MSBL1 archaeon SCGC-AAA259E17]
MYESWGWNTEAELVSFYLENVDVKGKRRTGFLIMKPQQIRSVIWNSFYEKEEFKKEFGKNEFWIARAFTNNDRLTFIFLVPVDVLWERNLIDVIIKDTPVREHDKKLFVNSLA